MQRGTPLCCMQHKIRFYHWRHNLSLKKLKPFGSRLLVVAALWHPDSNGEHGRVRCAVVAAALPDMLHRQCHLPHARSQVQALLVLVLMEPVTRWPALPAAGLLFFGARLFCDLEVQFFWDDMTTRRIGSPWRGSSTPMAEPCACVLP